MAFPETLETLIEEGVIDGVRSRLMSGKEASVFVVERQGELLAAKVYKAREQRTFKATASYTEGRNQTRNSRDKRAMGKRSSYGKELIEESWRDVEARVLSEAFHAGVRVPKPFMLSEDVLLMELVVDEEGNPAPRLADFELPRDVAERLHREIYEQVRLLLGCGKVHGDLSAFNILMARGGPTLIDLPQVVDAAFNNQAREILRRDLRNVTEHLARFDARLLRFRDCGDALWQHYVNGTLETATEPQEGGVGGGHHRSRRQRDAERGRMGRERPDPSTFRSDAPSRGPVGHGLGAPSSSPGRQGPPRNGQSGYAPRDDAQQGSSRPSGQWAPRGEGPREGTPRQGPPRDGQSRHDPAREGQPRRESPPRSDAPRGASGPGNPRGEGTLRQGQSGSPSREEGQRPGGSGYGGPREGGPRPGGSGYNGSREEGQRPGGSGYGAPREGGSRPGGSGYGPPREGQRSGASGYGPPREGQRVDGSGPPREGQRSGGSGYGPPREGQRVDGSGPPREGQRSGGSRYGSPREGQRAGGSGYGPPREGQRAGGSGYGPPREGGTRSGGYGPARDQRPPREGGPRPEAAEQGPTREGPPRDNAARDAAARDNAARDAAARDNAARDNAPRDTTPRSAAPRDSNATEAPDRWLTPRSGPQNGGHRQ